MPFDLRQTHLVFMYVLAQVNTLKEGNAGVILADGTSLGRNATINYNELAGVLGESLKAIISMRNTAMHQNNENGNTVAPLLYVNDYDLENMITDAISTLRANQKKKSTVQSNDMDSDEESDSDSSFESAASDTLQTKQETLFLVRNERSSHSEPSDDDSNDSIFNDNPIGLQSNKSLQPDDSDDKLLLTSNVNVKNELLDLPIDNTTMNISNEFVQPAAGAERVTVTRDGDKNNPVDLCI